MSCCLPVRTLFVFFHRVSRLLCLSLPLEPPPPSPSPPPLFPASWPQLPPHHRGDLQGVCASIEGSHRGGPTAGGERAEVGGEGGGLTATSGGGGGGERQFLGALDLSLVAGCDEGMRAVWTA